MGAAAEMMQLRLDADGHAGVAELRDHFEQRLMAEIDGVQLNGSKEFRISPTDAKCIFASSRGMPPWMSYTSEPVLSHIVVLMSVPLSKVNAYVA